MSYDFPKTQFLTTDHGTHTTIKAYRRSRQGMLFDRDGKPIRPMTWQEWNKFKRTRPETDGLTHRNVWTMVEITSR